MPSGATADISLPKALSTTGSRIVRCHVAFINVTQHSKMVRETAETIWCLKFIAVVVKATQ